MTVNFLEMIEQLRGIEDEQRPRTYGNLKLRGRLLDGFAMMHGVDVVDWELDEADDVPEGWL